MKSAQDPRWKPLVDVRRGLREVEDNIVFVGGSVLGLLLSDPAAPLPRPTDDIDLIVEIATRVSYYALADRLRTHGFKECQDEDAPLCRWVYRGYRVDIMPTDERVLGLRNRWFEAAMRSPLLIDLDDGSQLRVISAPYFCATKLEAFGDRGGGDYFASKDLEDFVSVVDGRPELETEIEAEGGSLREYLRDQIRLLLLTPAFVEALPGYLPGDMASQARVATIRARLGKLASSEPGPP